MKKICGNCKSFEPDGIGGGQCSQIEASYEVLTCPPTEEEANVIREFNDHCIKNGRKRFMIFFEPKSSVVTEHKSPEMPDANMSVQKVPEAVLGVPSGGSQDNSCVDKDGGQKIMGMSKDQGWCDTCKHEAVRNACLKNQVEPHKWGKPCRDCDIERNYLWEA